MEVRLASSDWSGLSDLCPGNFLSFCFTLPPSAESHPTSKEPEAKNQVQRQRKEQNPGRHSAILRLYHSQKQNSPTPFALSWSGIFWPQCAHFLSGKTTFYSFRDCLSKRLAINLRRFSLSSTPSKSSPRDSCPKLK